MNGKNKVSGQLGSPVEHGCVFITSSELTVATLGAPNQKLLWFPRFSTVHACVPACPWSATPYKLAEENGDVFRLENGR